MCVIPVYFHIPLDVKAEGLAESHAEGLTEGMEKQHHLTFVQISVCGSFSIWYGSFR